MAMAQYYTYKLRFERCFNRIPIASFLCFLSSQFLPSSTSLVLILLFYRKSDERYMC